MFPESVVTPAVKSFEEMSVSGDDTAAETAPSNADTDKTAAIVTQRSSTYVGGSKSNLKLVDVFFKVICLRVCVVCPHLQKHALFKPHHLLYHGITD
jgi:hypothetical protein